MNSGNIKIRAIAIHLPQFHPIPENDKWWGKGFTEWTNVVKAKPLFKDHYQPHLPADLGFYDLRLEQVRIQQAEMARENGIYGFCYYHYWFNGKRLLNEPLDDMLKTNSPDFPFMLCWANENWTKRWDGNDQDILMKQDYSLADHQAHAEFLCRTFFKDKRYITVDDKPVFIFYKTYLIPDIKEAIEVWEKTVKAQGFKGIYLLCMDNFIYEPAEKVGFSAAVHFHPDYRYMQKQLPGFWERLLQKLGIKVSLRLNHHVEDYENYNDKIIKLNKTVSKTVFPGVTPMWDNTARKSQGGIIFKDSTPEKYRKALQESINNYSPENESENFFFINAWNEWAEGNHLEPCQKWGHAYLDATKEVLKKRI